VIDDFDPATHPLTRETYQRMQRDDRIGLADGWTKERWLWEEIAQLNAPVGLQLPNSSLRVLDGGNLP